MAAEPTPTTRQLVVCSLGEEEYALPIEQVREIVRASAPRPVASDVPWMRGVINLRGRLVPVYDLAARLGFEAVAAGDVVEDGAKIVIVETAEELAGVVVDDVVEVLTIGAEQIEDVPGVGADVVRGAASIVKLGDRLVLLLDPADLLAAGAEPEDGVRTAA